MFEEMRAEEANHRDRLIATYRERFGDHIPPIRRENVKGFLRRNPSWLVRPFGVNKVRRQAEVMEMEAGRFYAKAVRRITDAPTRELLNKLADEERKHQTTAGQLGGKGVEGNAKKEEKECDRQLFF